MGVWEIEHTVEFERWWEALAPDEQTALDASIRLLEQHGPMLGRPHADSVQRSKHANMKELRTQHRGRPLRTLFAFDPRRHALLLVGGDKTGDKRWYDRMIRLADRLYDEHLARIERKE